MMLEQKFKNTLRGTDRDGYEVRCFIPLRGMCTVKYERGNREWEFFSERGARSFAAELCDWGMEK